MSQQVAVSVENSFIKGLITEATGLNFPENACIETFNCVFDISGTVSRRLGFDLEADSEPVSVSRSGVVTASFLWRDAGGYGSTSFLVQQVGDTLRFFNTGTAQSISAGLHATTIDLTDFSPADAPSPALNECQYSSGNGYLFVTHPYLEPFYVSYDFGSDALTATQINLKVRDVIGEKTDANYDDYNRPASLTNAHKYNLLNQGWSTDLLTAWHEGYVTVAGSTTSGGNTVGGVSSQTASTLSVGMLASSGANGVSGKTIISVRVAGPSAAAADTNSDFQLSGTASGSGAVTGVFQMNNYPGNGDVWWAYKNEWDVFSVGAIAQGGTIPSSQAPRGHYISSAYSINRNTLSGLSGLTTTSCGVNRPATTAFYAGRVWYSGVSFPGFASNVYFSQLLDDVKKAGNAYQVQDPTSEDLSDLLPTDGGVITIHGAGTIYKLVPLANSLLVFASNGVYEITGSAGIGFTPNDTATNRVSTIPSISSRSFVETESAVIFWNTNGIYAAQAGQQGTQVASITDSSISTFLDSIPNENKANVRGAYNPYTKVAQWVYRSIETTDFASGFDYDAILNFNTLTQAWYPWTIDATNTRLNDIFALGSTHGAVAASQMTDGGDLVVDGADDVVVFSASNSIVNPDFRYTVSTPDGGSYDLAFAHNAASGYTDWSSTEAKDYTSEFVSGYRLRGQGQKKFQPNWFIPYGVTPSTFYVQGIWDFAVSTDSNRFSTRQLVTSDDTNFSQFRKRLKVRGRGVVLNFRIQSVTGLPFSIIGWSVQDITNAAP